METTIILGHIDYSFSFNTHKAHIKTIEGIYKTSTKEEHIAILEALEKVKKNGMDTFLPGVYKGRISISKTALLTLLR